MLRAVCVAGILPFLAWGQDEVAQKDAQATFNTRVNLVMVPVVVRDKLGHTVGDLKKEDFQLFDRGKPQLITRFAVEKASDRIKPAVIPSDDAEEPKPAANPGAKPVIVPARFLAFVFDDLHMSVGDLAQSRSAAKQYLAERLRPDERVAIYTTSGKVMLDFTDDLGAIGEALLRISPKINPAQHDCPPVSYYMADMIENKHDETLFQMALQDTYQCANLINNIATPGGGSGSPDQASATAMVKSAVSRALAIGEQDAHVALGVLKDIARRMAAAPGERTMILVSGGFYLTDFERQEEVEMIDRAIRSNVIVNALDARGLYAFLPGGDASTSTFNQSNGPQTGGARVLMQRGEQLAYSDILGELAEGTGGLVFQNSNDLMAGFARTTEAPEFVYMLGFSPQNLKIDGAYHTLKVSLTAKGMTLVARRGYFAPRRAEDEAEVAKDEIREALFSREEMQDIPLQVQTQFFKLDDQKARIAVVTKIDLKPLHFLKAEGRERDSLVVVAGVFDRNGNLVTAIQKTVDMRLKEETFEQRVNAGIVLKTSLDVTPGSYVIRVVLRDHEGHMMTARNRVLEIPY